MSAPTTFLASTTLRHAHADLNLAAEVRACSPLPRRCHSHPLQCLPRPWFRQSHGLACQHTRKDMCCVRIRGDGIVRPEAHKHLRYGTRAAELAAFRGPGALSAALLPNTWYVIGYPLTLPLLTHIIRPMDCPISCWSWYHVDQGWGIR